MYAQLHIWSALSTVEGLIGFQKSVSPDFWNKSKPLCTLCLCGGKSFLFL